jgi:hypothetical protein
MNLHANAALSLNKRRDLCQRVVERDWTVTKAAAAAEVSVRCARKWVGRYRTEGEQAYLIVPRLRGRSRIGPARSASKRSLRCGVCGSPALRSQRHSGWRYRLCLGY